MRDSPDRRLILKFCSCCRPSFIRFWNRMMMQAKLIFHLICTEDAGREGRLLYFILTKSLGFVEIVVKKDSMTMRVKGIVSRSSIPFFSFQAYLITRLMGPLLLTMHWRRKRSHRNPFHSSWSLCPKSWRGRRLNCLRNQILNQWSSLGIQWSLESQGTSYFPSS